jgi:hypothetical protein
MPNTPNDIQVLSHRGGLNEDAPHSLLETECTQADNVEFWDSMLGERRAGCAQLSSLPATLTNRQTMCHFSEWFPTNDVTVPEFIAAAADPGSAFAMSRRDTSGTWNVLTPGDTPVNTAPDIYRIISQPLDAVNYIAMHTNQNRLQCWDGTQWRRVGIAAPAAPTGADTGTAGIFTGTRYYRQRGVYVSGSTVLRRSEPSSVLTFQPSGSKNGATITKGADAAGELTTHWELEASLDNSNWYRIARTANATTTYTDQTASAKTYPAARGAGAPVSTDGTSITYVLLSNQAAALNLTGTVSNGTYAPASGSIAGRGWIGYDASDVYIALGSLPASLVVGQKYYASSDVASVLEQQAVGGSSQDYASTGTLSDAVGAYLTIGAAEFLIVDGDRLVYGGHFTDATLKSTVGWTPVGSDPGVGNAERAPIVTTGGTAITTSQDLDNYDGGPLTGLCGSTFGTWFGFKYQRIYSAIRTRDNTYAYDINTVTTSRGAIRGSIIKAADAKGNSVIYFLDPFQGPCQISAGGVVSTIRGLKKTWKRVNLKATSLVCCGTYYPRKNQIIWLLSVDGGNTPSFGIKIQLNELNVDDEGFLRGGISTITGGKMATARCLATGMLTTGNLTTEVPVFGLPSPDFLCQGDTGTDDNGTSFDAIVVGRPRFAAGLNNLWQAMKTSFLATADATGQCVLKLIRDQGAETLSSDPITLEPINSQTQVVRPLDNLVIAESSCVQVAIADAPTKANWQAQRIDLVPAPGGPA